MDSRPYEQRLTSQDSCLAFGEFSVLNVWWKAAHKIPCLHLLLINY